MWFRSNQERWSERESNVLLCIHCFLLCFKCLLNAFMWKKKHNEDIFFFFFFDSVGTEGHVQFFYFWSALCTHCYHISALIVPPLPSAAVPRFQSGTIYTCMWKWKGFTALLWICKKKNKQTRNWWWMHFTWKQKDVSIPEKSERKTVTPHACSIPGSTWTLTHLLINTPRKKSQCFSFSAFCFVTALFNSHTYVNGLCHDTKNQDFWGNLFQLALFYLNSIGFANSNDWRKLKTDTLLTKCGAIVDGATWPHMPRHEVQGLVCRTQRRGFG